MAFRPAPPATVPTHELGVSLTQTQAKLTLTSLSYESLTNPSDRTKIKFTFLGFAPGSPAIGSISPTTFTREDLNNGSVVYNVDKMNLTEQFVKFRFTVVDENDGTTKPNLIYTIRYTLQDTPPLGTVGPLTVKEGMSANVTTSQINFKDAFDGPNAIFIVPQAWPQHGKLIYNGAEIGPGFLKLSMDDILNGKLKYQHTPGDESETDEFAFKVRDAKNKWTGSIPPQTATEANANVFIMPIIIQQVDIPLEVTKQGPISIGTCADYTLTVDDLFAVDEDHPALVITFELEKLPLHNTIKLNGTPLAVGGTFTLDQIPNITITQDCTDTAIDEFFFKASTTRDVIPNNKFVINLIPNLPPQLEINGLEVPRGEAKPVTNENIIITDPEGKTPDQIILEITGLPEHGKLLLGGIEITAPGVQFNYSQISDLVYQHDGTSEPNTDFVYFNCIDGTVIRAFALPIIIIFTVTKAPFMSVNETQECERNGDVLFDTTAFDFDDEDSTPDVVFWEAVELCQYGTLNVDKGDGFGYVPIAIGDKWNHDQWVMLKFRYVADNPANQIMEDIFTFKLYDETPNTVEPLQLHIKFPEPAPECPNLSSETLVTAWRLDTPLTELNMQALTTGNTDATAHVYTLVSIGTFGKLKFNDGTVIAVGGTWTQDDINNLRVMYYGDTTTEESDLITYNVTNGSCAVDGSLRIEFQQGLTEVKNGVLNVVIGTEGEPNPSVTTVIGNDKLKWDSAFAEGDLTKLLYVYALPSDKGGIFLDGVQLGPDDEFTQADIDAGKLSYVTLDGLTTRGEDAFDYQITDGFTTQNATFPINLITVEPIEPVEIILTHKILGEATCGEITGGNINFHNETTLPEEIVFTLTVLPLYGELTLADALAPMTVGETFTWQNILDGDLTYCNTTTGDPADSFGFDVELPTDTVSFSDQVLPIEIIIPPPPELVNNPLSVEPCVEKKFTRLQINIWNREFTVDTNAVTLRIVSLPTKGTLKFSGQPAVEGQTFLLRDLIGGRLSYITNPFETGQDTFLFDVESSILTQTGNTFVINITNVLSPPWLCLNAPIMLFEGESQSITLDNLQVCDIDLDADTSNGGV